MKHIWDDKVNDVEFRKKVCENKDIVYESLLRKYKILKADYEKLQEEDKSSRRKRNVWSWSTKNDDKKPQTKNG